MVRFFIEQKLQPFRFHSIGYAHTRPKVPNRDSEGNPLRENQATNRRIQKRVELMRLKEQEKCLAAQNTDLPQESQPDNEVPQETKDNG